MNVNFCLNRTYLKKGLISQMCKQSVIEVRDQFVVIKNNMKEREIENQIEMRRNGK